MSYVVFNVKNTRVLSNHLTERGAKIAATAANKRAEKFVAKYTQWARKKDVYMVCTMKEFADQIDEEITVKNLMSGKDVQIRKSEAGGCCDPSTETYWSM